MENGNDYDQVVAALKTMEDWDPADRRPMIVIGKTDQGLLAGRGGRQDPEARRTARRLPEPSLRDEDELRVLRRAGGDLRRSATASSSRAFATARSSDPRERLIQFKTNIDMVMSVLDRNGLGDWLADRLVAIGDTRQGRRAAAHSTRSAIRFWTSGCASRIFPSSRRRSR